MNWNDEFDTLGQVQREAEQAGDEVVEGSGLDRRHFVFMSVVAAAATTFGFGAKALAQGAAGATGAAGQGQAPAPLAQLGNGEPVSWTFQPYPAGTGALMARLMKERGPAAFERSTHVVEAWTGTVPTSPDDIAFLPAHRLSALLKARKITSTQLTKIYLDRMKRLDPTLLCAVTIMESQAMAEAAAGTRRSRRGTIAVRCTAFRTA
jgi:hypothetical protein